MLRVHRAAVALVVAATVPGCVATPQASDAPPTEPVGVVLPTWHVGADGAAALLEGRLVLIDRCVYVAPRQGPPFLVVWPDTMRLAVVDDTPAVLHGSGVVAHVGGLVRLGGGELTPDMWPESIAGCDTSQVWGANSINP